MQVLQSGFGLIVEWIGSSCVRLYVPETYKSNVAGLCGLFNGDKSDDFTSRDLISVSSSNQLIDSNSYLLPKSEIETYVCTCEQDNTEFVQWRIRHIRYTSYGTFSIVCPNLTQTDETIARGSLNHIENYAMR